MPQIGWLELLIIVVVAIVVIGPKDFPIVLKKIGTWIRTIKNYFSDVQSNINQITNIEENNSLSTKEKKDTDQDDIK
ncbi:MAG: Sec-independent protein translocase protein TatB [Proteobacteria bacterium]|jgi:sec-independent protein translocase protein TatB|nr:Sec-independent protein translocase protein TatB [Pseudomonadota bacterium]